jgi:endonuclease/exonuclease/phosphatase family metal-dependent hydrolase
MVQKTILFVVTLLMHSTLVLTPEIMAAPSGCRGLVEGQVEISDQTIQWKNGADTDQYEALKAWCEAVGPAVFIRPSGYHSKTTPLNTLVIVSWNTRVGGGDLGRFIRDLRSGRLTEGEPVQHFVLLLQEVFRQGPAVPVPLPPGARSGRHIRHRLSDGLRIDIIKMAKQYGLGLIYVPAMRDGNTVKTVSPEDRGNAIVSTLPFNSPIAVELPLERQRRVAVAATFSGTTTSGVPWAFQAINVHLENRSPWSRMRESFGTARLNQIEALLKVLPPTNPTVLAGDFNTWSGQSHEPGIRFVERFFIKTGHTAEKGTVKMGPFMDYTRVDYIFYRIPNNWKGSYRRAEDTYGSDHYPLIGQLHFEE